MTDYTANQKMSSTEKAIQRLERAALDLEDVEDTVIGIVIAFNVLSPGLKFSNMQADIQTVIYRLKTNQNQEKI